MSETSERMLEEAQRLTREASVMWNAGSYPETEALCKKALALTRAAVGDMDRRVAESLYNLGALFHLQRRFEEAIPLYREAIGIYETQSWIDHSALAFCCAWLGRTLFEGWRDDPDVDSDDEGRSFREAESAYKRAMSLMRRSGAADSAEYAACLVQLGFLHYYCDRHAEAEPLLLQALALRESLFGPDHLETAEVVGRLAILYSHSPNPTSDPEPLMRRALAIRRNRLDPSDPEVLEWTYRLAELCAAAGRQAEAEALYSRLGAALLQIVDPAGQDVDWIVAGYLDHLFDTSQTIEAEAIEERWCAEPEHVRQSRRELKRRETMFGSDHPRVAETLVALADDLRFLERYDEALTLYGRALVVILGGRAGGEAPDDCSSPEQLPALNGLAMLFRAREDVRSAAEVLERACAIPYDAASPRHTLQHARAVEQLAWVRTGEETDEKSEVLFHRAIALVEALIPPDHRETAEMRYRFSMFLAQDGRFAEAEESILTALRAAEKTTELDALEIADYREQYAAVLDALDRPLQAAVQIAEVKRLWQESGSPRDDI